MDSVYANNIPMLNTKFVSIQDVLDKKYDIKNIELDSEIIINNKKILIDYLLVLLIIIVVH